MTLYHLWGLKETVVLLKAKIPVSTKDPEIEHIDGLTLQL